MSDNTSTSERPTIRDYKEVCQHRDILADALAEIMATHNGDSDQPIQDILDGCINEVAELKANDPEGAGREKSDLMRLVSRNTDIMERLGLVEGCLKDSEEYQRLHVDTIKQIIETCRDLYTDYKMHHDPRVREVLMKEGLAFPETVEELEIFEKHNPPEKGSCDISAEEMLNRIKQKET